MTTSIASTAIIASFELPSLIIIIENVGSIIGHNGPNVGSITGYNGPNLALMQITH